MKRNRGVWFVSLATASSLLGDQMLYAVLPTIYVDLGLQPYQVGILLSANRVVRLVTNHLAERGCRRWSLAWLLIVALTTGALLNLVYGTVTWFPGLLAARIVWGVCWSFIRQIGLMTVVDAAREGLVVRPDGQVHLGRAMGFYSGISRLGSISGNLLGALGHDLIGFSATLFIFAAASIVCVPLGPWSRQGLPRTRPRDMSTSGPVARGLLFCGFASGCVGQGLIAATLGAVLGARLGDADLGGALGLGVASLTGLLLATRWVADLMAPLLGHVADRVGRRRSGAVYFIAGALVLAVAAAPQLPPAFMIAAILAFYVTATGVAVVLQAEAGNGGSRAVASYVTASDFGSAAGPNLGWLVLQIGGAEGTVFLLGAIFYALAGIAAWTSLHDTGK
ncbi:MAG: MFS transporter [bacterium]|nr:MFS transporter [bacterium]